MRKLLNTIYVTSENAYLCLDGENFVCRENDSVKARIPFDNIESIVCINYPGCSPALMGKCAQKLIPISFISPQGKFLAKVYAGTRGNVFLRVQQIDCFRENGLLLAKNSMAAKVTNSVGVLRRTLHDTPDLRSDPQIVHVVQALTDAVDSIFAADSYESLLGIEGACAKEYYGALGKAFKNPDFSFDGRNKRPPLDPVNAVLSFVYTLYTNEFAAGLETVGLDSYIGFYHKLRSGRSSLACDLVEEARCIVDRFTITLFNLKILQQKDFQPEEGGAVYLNDGGRKKVIAHWQEKKRSDIVHPYLKQKIQLGLLPYVQSNLLAKHVRGELEEYPCYLNG